MEWHLASGQQTRMAIVHPNVHGEFPFPGEVLTSPNGAPARNIFCQPQMRLNPNLLVAGVPSSSEKLQLKYGTLPPNQTARGVFIDPGLALH